MKTANVKKVPIELVQPNDYNPNVMPEDLFNALAEDLSQEELDQPVVVREVDGKYVIVDGEHRYRASKAGGYSEILVSIRDMTDNEAKIATVRRNTIHGTLDPIKFTQLVQSIATETSSSVEEVRRRMAMREKEFHKTFLGMTEKKEVSAISLETNNKNADKAKAVANLSEMVRNIVQNYGSTLDQGFVSFMLGGQSHLMVSMTGKLKTAVAEFTAAAKDDGLTQAQISDRLAQALKAAIHG